MATKQRSVLSDPQIPQRPKGSSNGLAAMSKDMVTVSRTWAAAARDAAMWPWVGFVDRDAPMGMAVLSFMEMVRFAHDTWLALYEAQAHEMIDRTANLVEQLK